jgi:VCBS repeat-containing protein
VAQNDANAVTEDTALVANGNVLVGAGADTVGADVNATPVTPATVALNYGNLVLNADGSYTYTLNNANPAVNALNNGQSLTDSYTYTLTDGDGSSTTATLTITINGTALNYGVPIYGDLSASPISIDSSAASPILTVDYVGSAGAAIPSPQLQLDWTLQHAAT